MHKSSQGNQNLSPFNPEIKATARQQCNQARRKEAAAVMVEWGNRGL